MPEKEAGIKWNKVLEASNSSVDSLICITGEVNKIALNSNDDKKNLNNSL